MRGSKANDKDYCEVYALSRFHWTSKMAKGCGMLRLFLRKRILGQKGVKKESADVPKENTKRKRIAFRSPSQCSLAARCNRRSLARQSVVWKTSVQHMWGHRSSPSFIQASSRRRRQHLLDSGIGRWCLPIRLVSERWDQLENSFKSLVCCCLFDFKVRSEQNAFKPHESRNFRGGTMLACGLH